MQGGGGARGNPTLRLRYRILWDGGLQGVSPGRKAHSELELGVGAESLEQSRLPATQGLQKLAQLSYHSAWL